VKILLIDRDEASSNQIALRLQSMGYDVMVETSREIALEMVGKQDFKIVIADPSPLREPRQFFTALRNASKSYPYIIMLNHEKPENILKSGANKFINKPVDPSVLEKIILEATDLLQLRSKLSDIKTDYPSERGIISKSAFNQIFLSCVERADRHGEPTFCLFIKVENYRQLNADSSDAANLATAKLAHELSATRRQSDILGQLDEAEYAVLFLLISSEGEPHEASLRFMDSLSSVKGFKDRPELEVVINLKLVELPSGATLLDKSFSAQ
tara:strand:+ start:656 stop:1465 length:810 start_codon:yes stop_codon:yes gene_type:complete